MAKNYGNIGSPASALTGNETLWVRQGGVTKDVTAQAIADLAGDDVTYENGSQSEYYGDGGAAWNGGSILSLGVQTLLPEDTIVDEIEVMASGTSATVATARVYELNALLSGGSAAISGILVQEFSFSAGTFNVVSGTPLRLKLSSQRVWGAGKVVLVVIASTGGPFNVRGWAADTDTRLPILYHNTTNFSALSPYSRYTAGVKLRKAVGVTASDLADAVDTLNDVIATKQNIITPIISAPAVIYVADGREFNWWDGSIKKDEGDIVYHSALNGQSLDRCYRYTGNDSDTAFTLTTSIRDKNRTLITTKTTTIAPVGSGAGTGTKQILIIGDSVSASAVYQTELAALISAGGGITPLWLGTQGTAPLRHEGHSGWTVGDFVGTSSPFYDGARINLKGYMSDNSNFGGSDAIDYVIVHLGLNDMYSQAASASTIAEIVAAVLPNFTSLVASLLNATYGYPAAEVIISLEPIGADGRDGWGVAYGAAALTEQWAVDAMMSLWDALIGVFDAAAYSNQVSVCHSGIWVDRIYGYPSSSQPISAREATTYLRNTNAIHPGTGGQNQTADALYSHLMGLLTT